MIVAYFIQIDSPNDLVRIDDLLKEFRFTSDQPIDGTVEEVVEEMERYANPG